MAGEDRPYSMWIRRQACAMCGKKGNVEQHHMSGAGMGRRAHDHESMPLCHSCHHVRLGRLVKPVRREFEAAAVAYYRALSKIDPASPLFVVEPKRQGDLF